MIKYLYITFLNSNCDYNMMDESWFLETFFFKFLSQALTQQLSNSEEILCQEIKRHRSFITISNSNVIQQYDIHMVKSTIIIFCTLFKLWKYIIHKIFILSVHYCDELNSVLKKNITTLIFITMQYKYKVDQICM